MAALVRSPRTAHSLRLLFLTCSPPGKDTSWVGNAHPHLPAGLEEGDLGDDSPSAQRKGPEP